MGNDKNVREVFYYKRYFLDFLRKLRPEVQLKFIWTLKLISVIEKVPEKYLKYITNSTGLYEIRVDVSGNIYRVFSFFDEGRLIIVINGFQKKSRKTPRSEINLAEKLKKQYFDEKKAK